MRWHILIRVTALMSAVFFGSPAGAHESRPAYLELVETAPTQYEVFWKVPSKGAARLNIAVRLPTTCSDLSPRLEVAANDARATRWKIQCPNGLAGNRIGIDRIETTLMDAIVRVTALDGRSQTIKLSSSEPSAIVPAAPTIWQVAQTYFVLGVEHILFGVDHLLFVVTLYFLAGNWGRLLGVITAFTVAHSLTLAAATLGAVSLPSGPVEALIALSIVLAAAEALLPEDDRSPLVSRAPWIIAFVFGLLHGFGFAGALAEIGLPQGAIPLALLFFNLGVEAGQILFVLALAAGLAVLRDLIGENPIKVLRRTLIYGAGGLAAFWFIERTVPIII